MKNKSQKQPGVLAERNSFHAEAPAIDPATFDEHNALKVLHEFMEYNTKHNLKEEKWRIAHMALIEKTRQEQQQQHETQMNSRKAIEEMLRGLESHPNISKPGLLTKRVKNQTKTFEQNDFVEEIVALHIKNQKLYRAVNDLNVITEKQTFDMIDLKKKLDGENDQRTKLDDTWKSAFRDLIVEHNDKVSRMETKIKFLERQNEGYKASAHQASKALEQQHFEFQQKIPALESELKLKNDQKRELLQQKRDFEAKIRTLDAELKESKADTSADECPICFEKTSIERKWTAFLPCGHRTCSDCADKISSLPRSTNRRKCPNCRENINCFLVLEGIYEG